jgi:hypothetical protein
MLYQFNDFLNKIVCFFKPEKIVFFQEKEKPDFDFKDIYYFFLNEQLKLIKHKGKVKKIKNIKKSSWLKNKLNKISNILNLKNLKTVLLLSFYSIKNKLNKKNNNKLRDKKILMFAYKHQLINLIPLMKRIQKSKVNFTLITTGLRANELLILKKESINYQDL